MQIMQKTLNQQNRRKNMKKIIVTAMDSWDGQ